MITSVTLELNGQTTQLVYNAETGYYEAEVTAPNIPSGLLADRYYNLKITAISTNSTLVIDGNYDFRLFLNVVPEFIDYREQYDVDLVKDLTSKYQADIITEEEKAIWDQNLIGALNLVDLQRNEFNLYCVSTIYDLELNTKYNAITDTYNIPEIPRPSYYIDLYNNLVAARTGGHIYVDTPEVPSRPFNTYQKWNDIEKLLKDLYYRGIQALEGYHYTGELYSGETISII